MRIWARKNGTIGAITGRTNHQLKRSENTGKNQPAEKERTALREEDFRVDDPPQQQDEVKQKQGRRVRRKGKEKEWARKN